MSLTIGNVHIIDNTIFAYSFITFGDVPIKYNIYRTIKIRTKKDT